MLRNPFRLVFGKITPLLALFCDVFQSLSCAQTDCGCYINPLRVPSSCFRAHHRSNTPSVTTYFTIDLISQHRLPRSMSKFSNNHGRGYISQGTAQVAYEEAQNATRAWYKESISDHVQDVRPDTSRPRTSRYLAPPIYVNTFQEPGYGGRPTGLFPSCGPPPTARIAEQRWPEILSPRPRRVNPQFGDDLTAVAADMTRDALQGANVTQYHALTLDQQPALMRSNRLSEVLSSPYLGLHPLDEESARRHRISLLELFFSPQSGPRPVNEEPAHQPMRSVSPSETFKQPVPSYMISLYKALLGPQSGPRDGFCNYTMSDPRASDLGSLPPPWSEDSSSGQLESTVDTVQTPSAAFSDFRPWSSVPDEESFTYKRTSSYSSRPGYPWNKVVDDDRALAELSTEGPPWKQTLATSSLTSEELYADWARGWYPENAMMPLSLLNLQ